MARKPGPMPVQGPPPVPAEGRRLPPSRSISADMLPSSSLQRRSSTQALLDQLSAFAQDLHETHTLDIDDLKKELEESEHIIRTLLDEEVHERQEAHIHLEKRCGALERGLALLQKQLADGNDPAQQRIDNLENSFAAWADKSTRDTESLRKAHEAMGRELANVNAAIEHHLEVEESLDAAVKGLTSAAQQTAKALAVAKAKVDQLHETILSCEQHCTAAETKSSTLGERLREVERKFEHSTSNRSKDLELLRDDHQNLSIQVNQKISDANNLIMQHVASQKARANAQEEHHSVLLSKHEGQAHDLKRLGDENRRHSQDLSNLRQQVDGALEHLAKTTSRELKASRDDLDQILSVLSGVQRAWRPCNSRGQGKYKKRPSQESSSETSKEGYELSQTSMSSRTCSVR